MQTSAAADSYVKKARKSPSLLSGGDCCNSQYFMPILDSIEKSPAPARIIKPGCHGFSSLYSAEFSRVGLELQLFLFSRIVTGSAGTSALFIQQGFHG